MKKLIAALLSATLVTTVLTGCMGRNGLTKEVQDFNLDVVENRYGREGVFILLYPITWLSSLIDLFIINSIEFWSGENPISGQSPLVDSKVNTAALESLGIHGVASARLRSVDDDLLMYVNYSDGSQEVFHATRKDGVYSFYRGKELVLQVPEAQLKNLQAMIRAKMQMYATARAGQRES